MTRHAVLLAGLLTLAGSHAAAQTPTSTPAPAHLAVIDGEAVIERGTAAEPASLNMALVPGDRLHTDQGRVELVLEDGSAIHVDERTTLDLNSERVFRLLEGRIIILAEATAAASLQVDAVPASVRVLAAGEYRLSLFGDGRTSGIDVAVVRGEAEVAGDGGSARVQAGYMVSLREGEAPGWPTAFNTARLDAFVAWSEALTDGRRATTSAQYLPSELRVYSGSLDRYGTWGYSKPYGYVWYPRVTPGWRPYYEGRWRWTIGFGWTWVGGHAWAWPTHHYGRWGFSTTGSWFWIPSRGWSTAWVHWAISPGYVGWCPLGWNNRPVLSFWGHPRPVPYRGLQNPWYAWSVVRAGHFRKGAYVHRSRVPRAAFTGRDAPAFVVQAAPPNVAVSRGTSPGRSHAAVRNVAIPRGRTFSSDTAVRRGAPPTHATSAGGGSRRLDDAAAGRGRSPAVIYHRGRSPSARDTSPASAYDRAGVAVPRGQPSSTPRTLSPSRQGTRAGGAIRSRTPDTTERAVTRPGVSRPASSGLSRRTPDIRAPRSAQPSSAPRPAAISRSPRDAGIAAAPRNRRSNTGSVSAVPSNRGGRTAAPTRGRRSSQVTPPSRSTPQAGARSRSSAPRAAPPSRGSSSGRAASPSRGRSSGTAVPRRGGSRRPN